MKKTVEIALFLLCIFWSVSSFADQDGKFIYPVGDGSKPLNEVPSSSDQTSWDNQSIAASNLNDIGYYDIQIFGSYNPAQGGYHDGLDLNGNQGNDCGDRIIAVADGEVVESSYNAGGWGNFVRVKHQMPTGEFVYSQYAHLQSRSVSIGNWVTRGQEVGLMGNTGNSDGCHLHFSMPKTNTSGYGYYSSVPTGTHYDPDAFIGSHPIVRFTYNGDITTCASAPTGGASTNWYYSCPSQSYFTQGSTVWVLLRLHNVKVDHRFKVKAYRNGTFQWDWTNNPINVTDQTNGWQYSHFWPTLSNASIGDWEFKVYLLARDSVGDGTLLDSVHAVVTGTGFNYDDNALVCAGPVTGGQSTNWIYTCNNPKTIYAYGEAGPDPVSCTHFPRRDDRIHVWRHASVQSLKRRSFPTSRTA